MSESFLQESVSAIAIGHKFKKNGAASLTDRRDAYCTVLTAIFVYNFKQTSSISKT